MRGAVVAGLPIALVPFRRGRRGATVQLVTVAITVATIVITIPASRSSS
jgi:hypothetical protein